MTATASRPRAVGSARSLRDTAARIARGLATPVIPEDYLDLFAPLRSGADLRGRIVAITPETRDAATITIRPGRDWQGHAPGQYIRVGVDVDGVRHWRAYSLTSDTSARDGLISITVKAMPDGLVSQHLVHRATPGTIIQIDQASGDFVLPQSVPAKVLFLTGGSGITPVMGMLRNHDFDGLDVVHAHSAPTADDVIFARELADAPTGVRAIVRHTDEEGMLTPDELDAVVPDWRERETWICGPTPMLDAFEEHYAAHLSLIHI